MLFSEQQSDIPVAGAPMPNIGTDLMEADAKGYFEGLPSFRAMATLELLRHHEISLAQAAGLIGVSPTILITLLNGLPIDEFKQLALNAKATLGKTTKTF